jgi:Arc/MetJ-type ribon-helix-helix transcriptional regulator
MKSKISITIDENTIKELETHLEDGLFRNKSHLIDYAVKQFLKERK